MLVTPGSEWVKELNVNFSNKFNLRSGILFSEEGERKATRDSAVSRSVRL